MLFADADELRRVGGGENDVGTRADQATLLKRNGKSVRRQLGFQAGDGRRGCLRTGQGAPPRSPRPS